MMLNAGRFMILCLTALLISCATSKPEIVTQVETITLDREVLVPVPAGLVQEVPVRLLPSRPDTIDLGTTYNATVTALLIANMRLREIGKLNEREDP